jgi:hypothetical protein
MDRENEEDRPAKPPVDWDYVRSQFPVIPDFQQSMYQIIAGQKRPESMDGEQMSPGVFHCYDHVSPLLS